MTRNTKIGFIGLGMIGMPMARNIFKNGYELSVFDLRAAAVDQMVESGARGAARSEQEVADGRVR